MNLSCRERPPVCSLLYYCFAGLIFLLLMGWGVSEGGAEEVLTLEQMREDIRLLKAINKLDLTPKQGEDMLEHLEKIGQYQATIRARERQASVSLEEALGRLREAMIQGVPLHPKTWRQIDRELRALQKVYDRNNPLIEEEIRQIVEEVLTEEQRQRFEPDQAKQQRLARERRERKRRERVGREAVTVVEKWVRNKENVSDATYQEQRQAKATALATEALGPGNSETVQEVSQELIRLFDYCRQLDDRQYVAQQKAIQMQFQTILQPPMESSAEAYYIMSVSEFWEFLRTPRTAQLLRERWPYLSAGGE